MATFTTTTGIRLTLTPRLAAELARADSAVKRSQVLLQAVRLAQATAERKPAIDVLA